MYDHFYNEIVSAKTRNDLALTLSAAARAYLRKELTAGDIATLRVEAQERACALALGL